MYFVREILRNKTKSDEIYRKLSQEQRFESKKSENDRLYLDNLDFSITQTHEEIILKTNQLCNIFPKLKNNQRLLKKNFKIVY